MSSEETLNDGGEAATQSDKPETAANAAPSNAARLLLERLVVRDFRNLERVEIEPAARLNVIYGKNGHGKTSLLEAVYFAATSRSFRTHRPAELIRHGCTVASARARFSEHIDTYTPLAREQAAAVEGKTCVVRLDGNRPPSLAEFATRSPVVVFHPEELALSTGSAGLRRKLLDRVALFMDPASAEHRARYAHALRARQEILRRNSANSDGKKGELDAFETLCARHGAHVTLARQKAAEALSAELAVAFAKIAAPDLLLSTSYEAGGSTNVDEALGELVRRRDRDAFRPTAGFGPHRDDLLLMFGDHPARIVGSQGQHRALTLALKAAEAATVATVRGVEPILLLDDVSSELDPDRTKALFDFLGFSRGQIFLTTTRRDLIVTPGLDRNSRKDFQIEGGAIEALPSEGSDLVSEVRRRGGRARRRAVEAPTSRRRSAKNTANLASLGGLRACSMALFGVSSLLLHRARDEPFAREQRATPSRRNATVHGEQLNRTPLTGGTRNLGSKAIKSEYCPQ